MSKPMKIFLVSNMYPSDTDPLFGVFVKNFKEKLMERNVEFPVSSVIKGKRFTKKSKAIAYSNYYQSVLKNYRRDFDILYVHYLTHNSPILLLLLRLFGKKKKWVINVHGNDIIDSKGKEIDKVNKRIMKVADMIVTPSEYFKEVVLERYPFLKSEQIFVSPSGGIDANRFYPLKKEKNEIPILGLISRIDKGKGWDTFINALRILKNKGLKFSVIIAGQGLEEQDMTSLIKKYNLDEEVNFLGLIRQEELVALYNKMDVMIFPTEREAESLGLVGVEAMSCGTPVIGSNMAGPKTYIRHGENGFLFDPGDALDLAMKIEDFLNLSENEKENFAASAIKTAESYEANEVIRRLHERLVELL